MFQIANTNLHPTMTSIEMVEFINASRDVGDAVLAHADFLKKVPLVLRGAEGKFSCTYKDAQNKARPMYRFPKREACLMAMSYSYELQSRVYDRMTELEKPHYVIPQTYGAALRLAAEQQEIIEAQRPAVEFVGKYVKSDSGNKTFREVAKLLGANERELRQLLAAHKIMYKLAGEWTPYASHLEAGHFEIKTGVAEYEDKSRAYTTAKFTPAGVTYIAKIWNEAQP